MLFNVSYHGSAGLDARAILHHGLVAEKPRYSPDVKKCNDVATFTSKAVLDFQDAS